MSKNALASINQALLKNGFPQPDLDQIQDRLATFKLRKVKAGEVLIKEGDKAGDAYITHAGRLGVFKHADSGETRIAELGPGVVVGEMALLTGYARTATVKAASDCEVFVVTPKDFTMLLNSSAAFKAKMDALVEERKRELARV